MNWFAHVSRYLWNRDTTPYFTAVAQLTQRQARYEIFAYAVLVGSVFAIAGLAAVLSFLRQPGLPEALWALGACVVLWGCYDLTKLRSRLAARVVALAPVVLLALVLISGFSPKSAGIDKLMIIAFLLLLLRYGWRILAIHRQHGAGGFYRQKNQQERVDGASPERHDKELGG